MYKPLLKTHLPNNPAWPAINSINTSSHTLSKFLSGLIKTRIDMDRSHTCKNSKGLTVELKYLYLEKNYLLTTVNVDICVG